jgi:lipoprotein-anchoring transpeptidase ErfK/SrfK
MVFHLDPVTHITPKKATKKNSLLTVKNLFTAVVTLCILSGLIWQGAYASSISNEYKKLSAQAGNFETKGLIQATLVSSKIKKYQENSISYINPFELNSNLNSLKQELAELEKNYGETLSDEAVKLNTIKDEAGKSIVESSVLSDDKKQELGELLKPFNFTQYSPDLNEILSAQTKVSELKDTITKEEEIQKITNVKNTIDTTLLSTITKINELSGENKFASLRDEFYTLQDKIMGIQKSSTFATLTSDELTAVYTTEIKLQFEDIDSRVTGIKTADQLKKESEDQKKIDEENKKRAEEEAKAEAQRQKEIAERVATAQKVIKVSIADQTMYLYEKGQLVNSGPITSGKDSTPTVIGTFAIYKKQNGTYLSGPGYSLWVDHWMPFYSGYGIHDACNSRDCWRTVYGGQDYHYAGSHGCINTPYDLVSYVWNWADVGTPVVVY